MSDNISRDVRTRVEFARRWCNVPKQCGICPNIGPNILDCQFAIIPTYSYLHIKSSAQSHINASLKKIIEIWSTWLKARIIDHVTNIKHQRSRYVDKFYVPSFEKDLESKLILPPLQ